MDILLKKNLGVLCSGLELNACKKRRYNQCRGAKIWRQALEAVIGKFWPGKLE
jgi:hypothetical protein